MIDINKLKDEQKAQYFRVMGSALSTNNIAKNCHGVLLNSVALINNEMHGQIAQRLATAIDCLKNCIDLNDVIIEKASEEFIKKYDEQITEINTRDIKKAEKLDKKECKSCKM